MRRNYISPEFKYMTRPGTFNMVEKASFFGSKMLDIEDSIVIDNSNIVYYQNENGEQLNFEIERNTSPILYNTVTDKRDRHNIRLDPAQSDRTLATNTRWIFTIDVRQILSEYLFAVMKKERTFEGVKNDSTISKNVDVALRQYISANVSNRYELATFDFFVEYVALSTQDRLRYQNVFREITTRSNITTRIQSSLNVDASRLSVFLNQELTSAEWAFDYYYILYFNKI